MRGFSRSAAALVLAAVSGAACTSAMRPGPAGGGVVLAPGTGVLPPGAPANPAVVSPRRLPHTPADVHFMTGMIAHHAQAVLIAGWAESHGARADIVRMCERIVVGQGDEIVLMQQWLKDVGEPVPDAKSTRMRMNMNGMVHDMLMPGMLTDEEVAQLDKARGREFDRLFLAGMIKHHYGAIAMVEELFATPGAAQDEVVFKFASDTFADQTSEIDRMEKMLAALPPS
jgi:uncharacterized protein (DUF305 family)